jgi:hypothetical protein
MAIENPAANAIGGLNGTVVGLDTSVVYTAIPNGLTVNTTLNVHQIGPAGSQQMEDPRYPGKALQIKAITVQTAADALVNGAAGWYNRTGQTAPVGTWIVAVAA